MILIVSGEGNSDIGNEKNYGPMFKLIEYLLKNRGIKDFNPEFVPKEKLKEGTALPGKKTPKGTGHKYFLKNAYNLAKIASKKENVLLVVLFRDADTTDKREWEEKYNSMVEGFKAGLCTNGVSMLPQSTSETWLLSSILKSDKMNGKLLEDVGDRTRLKKELSDKISGQLYEYNYNFANIHKNIESYEKFRNDLNRLLTQSYIL